MSDDFPIEETAHSR